MLFISLAFLFLLTGKLHESWQAGLALEAAPRDLGCLEMPSGPPCPPPLVKQKRKRWRTSANSCQSCHALCRRLGLDEQLVEIPAETCRPASPPSPLRYHHYLLILYADLFHFTIFSSQSLRDKSLITLKCLKIQLRICDPDWRADRNVTLVIPRGCAPSRPP